jgi:hypothetical protein
MNVVLIVNVRQMNFITKMIETTLNMIFSVIAVTFLATLPMNKFTNAIIPTYFQFLQTLIIEIKFGIICILTNL